MTILYGTPEDPNGFRDYYYRQHIPLAAKMSGLTGWNLSWIDQDSAEPSPYILIAELYTRTREAMDEMLASPAGAAARADLDNFVTGSVAFLRGYEEEVEIA
ncbi:MAG TPA: EthD family reductase [Microlunatus sp.]